MRQHYIRLAITLLLLSAALGGQDGLADTTTIQCAPPARNLGQSIVGNSTVNYKALVNNGQAPRNCIRLPPGDIKYANCFSMSIEPDYDKTTGYQCVSGTPCGDNAVFSTIDVSPDPQNPSQRQACVTYTNRSGETKQERFSISIVKAPTKVNRVKPKP